MLLRFRSGRTAALVLGLGFGGGTVLLGVGAVVASPAPASTLLGALVGYLLAACPFFVLALLVGRSRSELWLVPGERSLRLLTYRPWLFSGPRVEQASLDEYAGVRTEAGPEADGGGTVVALVTSNAEVVPMREFKLEPDAKRFALDLATRAGLWLRHGDGPVEHPAPPPDAIGDGGAPS